MKKISLADFTKSISDIVEEAILEKTEKINEITKETSKEMFRRIKDTSPVESGKYKRGWRLKKEDYGDGYIVYNKTSYQLTHLIEYGTESRYTKRDTEYCKAGTFRGVMPKKPHIRPAVDEILPEYINKLKNI